MTRERATAPKTDAQPECDWAALMRWLDELHASGFYGTVTLQFRSGLVSIVKQQVLKPWDLRH